MDSANDARTLPGGADSVPVGFGPWGIASDSANGYVYVANFASNNVTVINGTTDKVVGSVPVGFNPAGVAYDNANGYVYVASENYPSTSNSNVTVINAATDTVLSSVSVGNAPWGLTYDSANGYVYVANYGSGNLTVINGATDKVVGSVPVGSDPEAVAYDSANLYVYVANEDSSNVTVVNGATDKVVGSVVVGFNPSGVAYDSTTGYVYVTDNYCCYPLATSNVTVINGATDKVVGSVLVGDHPDAVAYDNANGYVYVANELSGNVTVINGVTDAVIGWVPVGGWPDGVAYDSANGYVYVANSASESVTVINPAATTYQVTFTEIGLPSGTDWFLNLTGGGSYSSSSDTISFNETGGTYQYSVATTDKEYAAASGSFTSFESAVSESVVFSLVTFNVTFTASGLPSGIEWWVNGTSNGSYGSSTSIVTFQEPNGTYLYTVATADKEYTAVGGSITVNGAPVSDTVTFNPVTYGVTFTESGLPSGTEWFVNISGKPPLSGTGATLSIGLPNGSYTYIVWYSGYNYVARGGVFTVNGAPASEPVTFVFAYKITFVENGLPSGTAWQVTVAGSGSYRATTSLIGLLEPNGSYTYAAASSDKGYSAWSGEFAVSGNATSESVAFDRAGGCAGPLLATGSVPWATAVDSRNDNVYVTNWGSNSITVINGSTGAVLVPSISVGYYPEGIAYDNLDGGVYVANTAPGSVTVINASSDTVVVPLVPSGYPALSAPVAVVIDSWNGNVYVTNPGLGGVTVLNGTSNTVTVPWIPVGSGTFPTGGGSQAIAFDSANGDVYVANSGSNNVTVINGETNSVSIPSIPVGSEPWAIAFDPANGYLYVGNAGSNNVTVIDGATNKVVVPSISVGTEPWGIAVDSDSGSVYVVNQGSENLTVINGSTDLVAIPSVGLGGYPVSDAFDGSNGHVYVTVGGICLLPGCSIENGLSVINGATNQVCDIHLSLSPTSGPVGTEVTVTGSGYSPRTSASVAGPLAAGCSTDVSANGEFSCTFAVPSMTAGDHSFTGTDSASDTATATFAIEPDLTASQSSGWPGRNVTFSATGYAGVSAITVTWSGGTACSGTTSGDGSYSCFFMIPSTATGPYTFTATDSASNSAQMTIDVTKQLVTGSSLGPSAVWGYALIGGAGVVVAAVGLGFAFRRSKARK